MTSDDPGLDAFYATTLRAVALADCRHGTDIYRDVVDGLDPADRVEVEAACDRHASRQRAAGKPGW